MNKGFFDGPIKTATSAKPSNLAVAAADDEEAEGWEADDIDVDGMSTPRVTFNYNLVQTML